MTTMIIRTICWQDIRLFLSLPSPLGVIILLSRIKEKIIKFCPLSDAEKKAESAEERNFLLEKKVFFQYFSLTMEKLNFLYLNANLFFHKNDDTCFQTDNFLISNSHEYKIGFNNNLSKHICPDS